MLNSTLKNVAIATIAFCTLLFSAIYWIKLNHALQLNEQKQLVRDVVIGESSSIERRLAHTLSATYILAQEVRRTNGEFPHFDAYADSVMKLVEGISNLQLAPGGVITQIHPLAGNERAIGHDILNDDKRRAEARLAIEERRLTLAGPFPLVQGGVAIIGRNPVFVNHAGAEKFWGFVSVLIYLDDLLSVTTLEVLEKKGYKFRISRIHPDTGELDIIFRSNADLEPSQTLSQAINVPNANWTLEMSRNFSLNPFPAYIGSFAATLLLSFLLFNILQQPASLRRKVAEKTEQLQELAYHDQLTGLANRRLLNEQLEHAIHSSMRENTSAVLMYIDLDDFKRINDTLGHEAGDQLLQEVSHRLTSALRKSDIVARLGGDEFALLVPNAGTINQVQMLADKIIKLVQEPVTLKNSDYHVSASVGITVLPDDGQEVSTLFRNSDLAMYAAKREGKGRAHFFDHSMQKDASQSLLLEQDLRIALENDELFLEYQPLVNLAEQKVEGFEALIRWQHPSMGLLPPMEFIPVAEATGLVVPMGYWVLRKSCELIAHRKQTGLPQVYIAVNLAAQQFSDPDIVSKIAGFLDEFSVDPGLIELEITETALMDNFGVASAALAQLQALGISISIDDFGTGYSSLSHLKNLPANTLKIDRSFIDEVAMENSGDQKIVETILAMAGKLGLNVVAEGIETHEQLRYLQENGCNYGQGYLIAKPLAQELTDSYPIDQRSVFDACRPAKLAS